MQVAQTRTHWSPCFTVRKKTITVCEMRSIAEIR
jgi:hypothetical protein